MIVVIRGSQNTGMRDAFQAVEQQETSLLLQWKTDALLHA